MNIPKKVWSPNSPFGKEHSVFRGTVALSLCARGKARLVKLADAMASLTKRLEPARWTDTWLRAQFVKMGMPRSNGNMVLLFDSIFGESVKQAFMDEAKQIAEDHAFDSMVDEQRGGKVFAQWKNRPTLKSKLPGGPCMNSQQAVMTYKKKRSA